jgi:hypothetical protein
MRRSIRTIAVTTGAGLVAVATSIPAAAESASTHSELTAAPSKAAQSYTYKGVTYTWTMPDGSDITAISTLACPISCRLASTHRTSPTRRPVPPLRAFWETAVRACRTVSLGPTSIPRARHTTRATALTATHIDLTATTTSFGISCEPAQRPTLSLLTLGGSPATTKQLTIMGAFAPPDGPTTKDKAVLCSPQQSYGPEIRTARDKEWPLTQNPSLSRAPLWPGWESCSWRSQLSG